VKHTIKTQITIVIQPLQTNDTTNLQTDNQSGADSPPSSEEWTFSHIPYPQSVTSSSRHHVASQVDLRLTPSSF